MPARRLVPLVLAVAGLLALAALAAHGKPIGHSRGSGPTPAFFDYVFTSVAIVAAAIAVVFLWSLTGTKWSTPGPQRKQMYWLQLIATFLVATILGLILLHARLHWLRPHQQSRARETKTLTASNGANARPNPKSIRNARLKWDEVAIVLALLAALGIAMFAARGASRPPKEWRFRSHEDVALALDESLDDLRNEPDVRRAIIAAYARMEQALAAAGVPRRPSEAPFEYLSRALRSLDASAGAVTRLTDLFERAKFSHHALDESMRTEAIEALVDVRDELRAPVEAAA